MVKCVSYERGYILYNLEQCRYYRITDSGEDMVLNPTIATIFTLQEAQDTVRLLDKDGIYIIVDYNATVTKDYSIKNNSFNEYTKAVEYCKKKYGDKWLEYFKLIPCFVNINRPENK